MIESRFASFQMQIEGLFGYSSELREPNSSPPPKAFNAVYVTMAVNELVVSMLDPIGVFDSRNLPIRHRP